MHLNWKLKASAIQETKFARASISPSAAFEDHFKDTALPAMRLPLSLGRDNLKSLGIAQTSCLGDS